MGSPSSLLVSLCMTLTLALVAAQETWMTEYREDFTFSCPENKFLTSLQSIHNNQKEDRIWRFQCGSPTAWAITRDCGWTDFINDYDKPMFFSCPINQAMVGIQGTYNIDHEDRRFKIRCCSVQGNVLHSCELTDFQNELDGELNFVVPDRTVISGMDSYHTDYTGDRSYRFIVCRTCGSRRCNF